MLIGVKWANDPTSKLEYYYHATYGGKEKVKVGGNDTICKQ